MNGTAPGWEAPTDSFARMADREVLLLLGGNRGDPKAELDRALEAIEQRIGPVLVSSRDHWSEPWGFSDPQLFLNRAIAVRSKLDPEAALAECLAIEKDLGRDRGANNGPGPRNIDIDILAIGDLMIDLPGLHVPHPRLSERRFALAPLADIRPSWRHPANGRTTLELLNDLQV